MAASGWQVRDELWQVIEPLPPRHEPGPRGGRPRVDDCVAFGAIVFVLVTGIARRRLQEWQRAGVFGRLHRRRLRIRDERHAELHLAFLELGCAVVCQRMPGWA